MGNALAVYSAKPAISGKKLVSAAADDGIELRFLALGGLIPSDPAKYARSLQSAGAGSALVVGGFENDLEALAQFDEFVDRRDRVSMAKQLNGGELPWIELLTARFNYAAHLKTVPRDEATLDKAVPAKRLPDLKASRTRYIVVNESESKNGGELMKRLADVLASASTGVVAKHSTPKR